MIWRVFDTALNLQGFIPTVQTYEIQHHFYETNTLHLEAANDSDMFALLKVGSILNQTKSQKGFLIHSVELATDESKIYVDAFGIESILNDRVVIPPKVFSNATAEFIMQSLVAQHMISPSDTKRRYTGLVLGSQATTTTTYNSSYCRDVMYDIFTEMAKNNNIGYRFRFDPIAKQIYFETYLGVDRTVNQSTVEPIAWRSKWNDITGEQVINSTKSYKNVVYSISGDDTNNFFEVVDNENLTGWNRKELVTIATDITRSQQDENGTVLTETQLREILKTRGKLELYRNFKQSDFTFILSPDLNEKFGEDFDVGDMVSVIQDQYGIIQHKRIIGVREEGSNEQIQYEIQFED